MGGGQIQLLLRVCGVLNLLCDATDERLDEET